MKRKTGSERERLHFGPRYGDFHRWAPVAAPAQTQQLLGTHLEYVGPSWDQTLQLHLGALERTQLEEKNAW